VKNPIAVSIVVAGALVGLGLAVGVRGRTAPAASSSGDAAGAASPSAARPVLPPRIIDQQKARTDASAALEAFRRKMIETCWGPALARSAKPATSRYQVNFTFAGDGLEIARGISEVRDQPSRPDVAGCLRQQQIGLRIPAPGGAVQFELPLAFP